MCNKYCIIFINFKTILGCGMARRGACWPPPPSIRYEAGEEEGEEEGPGLLPWVGSGGDVSSCAVAAASAGGVFCATTAAALMALVAAAPSDYHVSSVCRV